MADKYDIFVSYTRADNENGWISGFIDALQAEQRKFTGDRDFKIFFDKDDIKSLDDWQRRIYTGLYESRMLVAFISPRYFASEWCRREWRTWIDVEISKHILSDGAAPIYIVQVPWLDNQTMSAQQVNEEIARLSGRDIGTLPPSLGSDAIEVSGQVSQRQLTQARSFFDSGIEALRKNDLKEVLATLAKELSVKAEHVEAAARSRSTIPPYNRRFVGRLKELIDLRDLLDRGRTGVISGHKGDSLSDKAGVASVHGLGGIGKTELAFTYAHAFAGLYPGGRFLVSCEGLVDLRLAMLKLDPVFHDQISDEQRKSLDLHFGAIRERLRDRLQKLGRVLLILDNVSDLALIHPEQLDHVRALGSDLHMLATTRLGASEHSGGIYDDVQWLTLGELSFEDSLRLLEKHRLFASDEEQFAAGQIARRLGGFALCVEIVGAYLGQHPKETYASYLGRMGLSDLELVDITAERKDVITRRHNNEKRLTAILAPILDMLSEESRTLLAFAAHLPPDHVAIPWLGSLMSQHPPGTVQQDRSPSSRTLSAIGHLIELSLLSREDSTEKQTRTARMHRLVQTAIRDGIDAARSSQLQEQIDELVSQRSQNLDAFGNWTRDEWEVSVIEAFSSQATVIDWLWSGRNALSVIRILMSHGQILRASRMLPLANKVLFTPHHSAPSQSDKLEKQQLLSDYHLLCGDVANATGDSSKAFVQYTVAQNILKDLLQENPTEPRYMRLMSAAHGRIGESLMASNDLRNAEMHFSKCLMLAEKCHRITPEDEDSRLALASAKTQFGTVCLGLGDTEGAKRHFSSSVFALRESPPLTSSRSQRLLQSALSFLADAFMDEGEYWKASDHHKECLQLAEDALRADPMSSRALSAVRMANWNLAQSSMVKGDPFTSSKHFKATLDSALQIVKAEHKRSKEPLEQAMHCLVSLIANAFTAASGGMSMNPASSCLASNEDDVAAYAAQWLELNDIAVQNGWQIAGPPDQAQQIMAILQFVEGGGSFGH